MSYPPFHYITAVCLLLYLMLVSCTEELDIDTGTLEPRLVIFGAISTDTTSHYVRLSSTANYYESDRILHVSGAEVTITVGDSVYPLTETEDPGIYGTGPDVFGEPGKTYTLDVKVDFEGDGVMEHFTASSLLPPPVHMDTVVIGRPELDGYDYDFRFTGRFPDNEGYYFSLRVARNGVIMNHSLSGLKIYELDMLARNELLHAPCFFMRRDNYPFCKGDTVGLHIDVLPYEYGRFLTTAKTEISKQYPFFKAPPANLISNIKVIDGAPRHSPLGFFGAYSTRRKHTFFDL